MKIRSAILLNLLVAAMLTSCAIYSHSTFSKWSGPSVFKGTGGTKRTVDGIDIWTTGTPYRRFQLLGILDQTNINDDSALSVIANLTSDQSLAADAKRVGGDAIIFVSADTRVTGYNTSINYGAAYAGPYSGQYPLQFNAMTSGSRRVAVIKYL